jgi:CVNH domain
MKKVAFLTAGMLFAAATPSLAANTYQNTCANVAFAYSGNNASLQAVCLRADGTPNPSSLMLQGISNQNGTTDTRVRREHVQQSCGNIQIIVTGPNSLLSAICRTSSGGSNSTSLSLDNISNNNGTLAQ